MFHNIDCSGESDFDYEPGACMALLILAKMSCATDEPFQCKFAIERGLLILKTTALHNIGDIFFGNSRYSEKIASHQYSKGHYYILIPIDMEYKLFNGN